MPPDGPKEPHDGPRGPQEGPSGPQNHPRRILPSHSPPRFRKTSRLPTEPRKGQIWPYDGPIWTPYGIEEARKGPGNNLPESCAIFWGACVPAGRAAVNDGFSGVERAVASISLETPIFGGVPYVALSDSFSSHSVGAWAQDTSTQEFRWAAIACLALPSRDGPRGVWQV